MKDTINTISIMGDGIPSYMSYRDYVIVARSIEKVNNSEPVGMISDLFNTLGFGMSMLIIVAPALILMLLLSSNFREIIRQMVRRFVGLFIAYEEELTEDEKFIKSMKLKPYKIARHEAKRSNCDGCGGPINPTKVQCEYCNRVNL